jgi:hypothetical protein
LGTKISGSAIPTAVEWRGLFDAVVAFKKLSCWQWMYDSDIFAIENPENGEIGYCSVLGLEGQVFGLVVFLGEEGFSTLMQLYSQEYLEEEDIDFLFRSKCIAVTFEDKEDLDSVDRELIGSLQYRFRGRKSWPRFRRYDPGYYPWYIDASDVRFLTCALQQAFAVSSRLARDEASLLHPENAEYVLLRRIAARRRGRPWEDAWHSPRPVVSRKSLSSRYDEIKARRVVKSCAPARSWELDIFFAPLPAKHENERPYYPILFLCLERETMLVLGAKAFHPGNCDGKILDAFLDIVEERGTRPVLLAVRKEELQSIFKPLASKLGIKLVREKSLRMDSLKDLLVKDYKKRHET